MCNRVLSSVKSLKRHLLIHEGKYRYTCEHCHKGFANKERMLEHLTSHTNQFYFKCDVCNQMLSSVYTLKSHKKAVHP